MNLAVQRPMPAWPALLPAFQAPLSLSPTPARVYAGRAATLRPVHVRKRPRTAPRRARCAAPPPPPPPSSSSSSPPAEDGAGEAGGRGEGEQAPELNASARSEGVVGAAVTGNGATGAVGNGVEVEGGMGVGEGAAGGLGMEGMGARKNVESGKSGEEKEAGREAAKTAGVWVQAWVALKRAFAPGGFFWGVAAGVAVSIAILVLPGMIQAPSSSVREKVTLFDFILHDIDNSYVDKVDINRLFETGINSMLGTLDPYTQFENNAQAVEMSVKTNGRYAGVGLGVSLGDVPPGKREREIIIVSAFEGYAFDAGIRPGDVIAKVAGRSVEGMSLEKVTDMLRGEPGTVVEVGVRREGVPSLLAFSLERKSVRIKDVPVATFVGNQEDGIGYIRLISFAKDAGAEVRAALQGLLDAAKNDASKPQLKGLVLDLRGNPGGLLNAAIDVAEALLPKDSSIVSTKGRGLGPAPNYLSSKDPLLPTDLPLAVLVNGQTASASEIVAGAVQDLDHGVIVGSKTFGKGLVQNVQELPFNTALKYTVGKYYTPSGRCIQALSYRQSDGEGPVEARKIEESQRQDFQTRRGRTVRDGGGIEPDVDVQSRPSFLEVALQRQNMYFRFANRYGAELKRATLPADFRVTDAMYRDFVKFISSSGFKYESKFDEAFSELDEMYREVGYDTARSRVGDLKRATQADMKTDFVRHEDAIRGQIESSVRYRFQPDSERIIAELRTDGQLAEAVRVLTNGNEYERLLSPKATADGQVLAHNSAVAQQES